MTDKRINYILVRIEDSGSSRGLSQVCEAIRNAAAPLVESGLNVSYNTIPQELKKFRWGTSVPHEEAEALMRKIVPKETLERWNAK